MRRFTPILILAALTIPSAGCTKPSAGDRAAAATVAPSDADPEFGARVRDYLTTHPEVIEEAVGRLQEKRQAAADTQLKQALASSRNAIERDPRDFVAGNPAGKVTVVEFFDYRCPYCKVAGPEIQKLIAANKDVRFVLKEFPILSPASELAARAAIVAKAQGKYWPVHQALLAEKNLDTASIDRVLKANGVDPVMAKSGGAKPEVTAQLDETHKLARAAGVTGTPAFVIGDRLISGWVAEDIQAGIDAERKKQAG